MSAAKPKILLVDDEAANLQALERTLRSAFDCTTTLTPQEALKKLEKQDFAAVISDQRMPGMRGTELLARVAKTHPHTTRLILTAYTDAAEILEAINQSEIYRYIMKPWDNADLITTLNQACERYNLRKENERLLAELVEANRTLEAQVKARTEELEQANARLTEMTLQDPLTRIANRRALTARFQEEIDRAERYQRPISVAMIDVDHFKAFNDMEGHVCGDEALKKIVGALAANLRKTDVLARYGGEEFVVLMPETSVESAQEITGRLRLAVENSVFQGKNKQAYLTISIGLCAFPKHARGIKELIEKADQAMYLAKQGGRNRVVVAK